MRKLMYACDYMLFPILPSYQCLNAPAFDRLLESSVSVRAAYAFGDWPPADDEEPPLHGEDFFGETW